MALRVTLFGSPRIERDGVEVRFDTRKAVALLAVLAVTGREHSRDSLAAMLWPDIDRSRARAALRRTLSVTAVIGPALTLEADRVGLDAGAVDCDVHRFRIFAAADDAESWDHADDLARAPLLEGFSLRDSASFDDWQLAAAETFRRAHAQVLARLADHHAGLGDEAAALDVARRRIAIDPLSEPAHVALMLLEARSGDRSAALQTYRGLARMLDSELGVPPLPETLALYDDIRADRLGPRPAAELPRGPRARTGGSVARRPATESPSVLVGRDDALLALRGAWERARLDGAVLGVVGEPGMGKTALIEKFVRELAASEHEVLRLTGHAAEQSLAYAGAHDLVRSVLELKPGIIDELGNIAAPLAVLAGGEAQAREGIGGPGDLLRLHEAMRAALAATCAARPALLVVDDAHRLDRPTAALVGYVTRRPPRGLLVIATWVPSATAAALPQTVVEAGPVLSLAPLDTEGIRLLVNALRGSDVGVDEIDDIALRTRGIPLLVRECATTGSSVDGGAREIVAARFDTAPETTRQVVAAAAVIGTVADPELLRQVAGRDELETVDAVEDAIARGLLVERDDRVGYDLPHELVRVAALSRLSLARTRLLHSRAADHLVRRHGLDDHASSAGAIALHWARAGRDDEAARWFEIAAQRSARFGAHVESLEQLRSALAHGGRTAAVHKAIGTALVRLGQYGEAIVSFEQAAASANNDRARLAGIEHAIAGVHDRLGDSALAQSHLNEARELLEVLGDTKADTDDGTDVGYHARIARIIADLALMSHRIGDDAAAEQLADDAQRRAAASGDVEARVQSINVLGVIASARGDHDAARRMLNDATRLARDLGEPDLLIAALNNLARAVHATGDVDGALVTAREALSLAEQQGDRHRLAALHSHVADLLHASGRDDEAMIELKSSAAEFAEMHNAVLRPEVWTLTEW